MSDELALKLPIGIVVIGRNEGERLVACLSSMPQDLPKIYVDSGSTDQSIENAKRLGADIVELDLSVPFTAARARNAGFEKLIKVAPDVKAVHFFDGDTILQAEWLEAATRFLTEREDVVAVAGRRRERFPEASWFNYLCDIEWNTPVGEASAIGGDALYRVSAFQDANGFNPTVIAGEEPELCLRLRQAGGKIHRLNGEMTLHDADIHTTTVWWKRSVRTGYAWMLGALMHGRKTGHYVKEVIRSLVWGAGLPLLALVASWVGFWWLGLGIVALYGLKWFRMRQRFSGDVNQPGKYSLFLMLANVAEVFGIAKCVGESFKGKRQIVEYK